MGYIKINVFFDRNFVIARNGLTLVVSRRWVKLPARAGRWQGSCIGTGRKSGATPEIRGNIGDV
jgi:hypothetical protein